MRKWQRSVGATGASPLERLLCAFGVHPHVADQFAGDLEESYHELRERFGPGAALADYALLLTRSIPHLGLEAWRSGTALHRARLILLVATVIALVTSGAAFSFSLRLGPPAEIFAEHASQDVIVVNNMKPARLPMRVADARGRELETTGLEYKLLSGVPMRVTRDGAITCYADPGDANVRVSLGSIVSTFVVRCQPVAGIDAASWITLVDGDAAKELPFRAVGPHGETVTELRGALKVRDSTIATLSGATIIPVSPGETEVTVTIGDVEKKIRVLVHERAASLDGLGPDRNLVAVPIRLARGDTTVIHIPSGVYWVKYIPKHAGDAPPTIMTEVTCRPGDGLRVHRVPSDEHVTYCMIMHSGGEISLGHGNFGAMVVEGTLAVERVKQRW
jgi:hypothetical protein